MKKQFISIVRKPGVPEAPAPFFVDGRPSWVSVLSLEEVNSLIELVKKPGSKFVREVETVHVDGDQVFP